MKNNEVFHPERIAEYTAVMEILRQCYEAAEFSAIFPYLADDVVCSSFWRWNDIVGKEAVMRYYIEKGRAVQETKAFATVELVRISRAGVPGPVFIWEPEGKPCLRLRQNLDGETVEGVMIPGFNEAGKLMHIALHSEEFFNMEPKRDDSDFEWLYEISEEDVL